MDERDNDDLERRLAGRLRPTRVPGADETWHRLASHLNGRPKRRIPRPTPLATAKAAGLVAIFLLVIAFIQLTPGRVAPSAVPGAVGVVGGSPVGWQPVLVSPKAGMPRVTVVADDPVGRERACGPWDTTASPGERFASAVCIAFLVAEDGHPSLANQFVSYGQWGEVSALFALGDIPGPPVDHLVAVVTIDRLYGTTYTVILDAATGAPYLIVWPN